MPKVIGPAIKIVLALRLRTPMLPSRADPVVNHERDTAIELDITAATQKIRGRGRRVRVFTDQESKP